MDGIKKVIQVFLIFLVILAFASCSVNKTVGISLFESSTDTLDWTSSLPDSAYAEPVMDSSQTTIVQKTEDLILEEEVKTEDSIILFPASADTVELPMTQQTPIVSTTIDNTLTDDPVTKTISAPVYSAVADSANKQLQAMLDTILLNQKILMKLYGTDSVAPAQNAFTRMFLPKAADTIVIKNEIYFTGSNLSPDAPVSTVSPAAERSINPYHDTIQYLLFEIRSLKQQLVNKNAPAANEYDHYDSISAQLNEIKGLLETQQLRIDNIAAEKEKKAAIIPVMSAETEEASVDEQFENVMVEQSEADPAILSEIAPVEQSGITSAVYPEEVPAESTIEPGDTLSFQKIDLDVAPDNADKDAYNQEFFLIKLYNQRIQDTAILLQNQIDDLKYELANQAVGVAAGIDTTITAFYRTGSNIALNEEEVLVQLIQLSNMGTINSIFLSGYTDKAGDAASNRYLSEQRVKTIQEKLIGLGFASQLIYSQYLGSEYASEEITDSDRRVDIRIRID